MNRQQALQTLSENRNQLKRFSVKDLYLFGSVVRDPAIYILPLILLLLKCQQL
jgi:predicted nucleotidyltransferase